MEKLKSYGQSVIKIAALMLFVVSVLTTLVVLFASQARKSGDFIFCDIALDHPAYGICKNVISLECVSSDRDGAFRPYEAISAKEFNWALERISKAKGIEIAKNIKFENSSEISKEALKKRFFSPSGRDIYDEQIFDCSRLAVFYMLEKCFFRDNYG